VQSQPPAPLEPVAHVRSAREKTIDYIAVGGLIVAGLGLIATTAQAFLAITTVDTPFRTLVYEQQVKQTIEAIDYMESALSDLDRWGSMRRSADGADTAVLGEMSTKMRRFAEIPKTVWLLPDDARLELGSAATHFNQYVAACEFNTYRLRSPQPATCHDLYSKITASLEQSKARLLTYAHIDRRIRN
jgi:hypothetical protein